MTEADWHQSFNDLLKFLEDNGRPVREFRRSFMGGSKKNRIYPILTNIYNDCKDKLEKNKTKEDKSEESDSEEQKENFIDWFNSRSFQIKSGLKTITLKCDTNTELFEQYLRKLFTHWDPEIEFSVPEKKKVPVISKKKMNKAMKRMDNMNPKQLKKTAASVSSKQVKKMVTGPRILDLAEQMQNDSTAQRIAGKLNPNP